MPKHHVDGQLQKKIGDAKVLANAAIADARETAYTFLDFLGRIGQEVPVVSAPGTNAFADADADNVTTLVKVPVEPVSRDGYETLLGFIPEAYAGKVDKAFAGVATRGDESAKPFILADQSADDELAIRTGIGIALIRLAALS